MSTKKLPISNGPDKADLLRAVANPDKHLHMTFDTPVDPVEVHIDVIEELGNGGTTFDVRGHISSGNLRGAICAGTYDVSSRTGRLVLKPI